MIDVLFVIVGTIVFWKVVGKPFVAWWDSVISVKFVRRKE